MSQPDLLEVWVIAIIIMWIGATYYAMSMLHLNQREFWSQ